MIPDSKSDTFFCIYPIIINNNVHIFHYVFDCSAFSTYTSLTNTHCASNSLSFQVVSHKIKWSYFHAWSLTLSIETRKRSCISNSLKSIDFPCIIYIVMLDIITLLSAHTHSLERWSSIYQKEASGLFTFPRLPCIILLFATSSILRQSFPSLKRNLLPSELSVLSLISAPITFCDGSYYCRQLLILLFFTQILFPTIFVCFLIA